MDKPEVRKKFMENMNQFLPLVKLNIMFMKLLESHSCKNLLSTLNGFSSNDEKKLFIFTEFNRDRYSCKELIEILKNCDQDEAAKVLEEYNQSTTPIIYSSDVEIKVKNAHTLRSGASRWFVMDGPSRGRVILFLQLDELKKEADRFDNIFQQLYFSVEIYVNYSCDRILDTLKTASEGEFKKDALIVMFIGHGRDQMVQGNGPSDEIHIKKLVDLFSESKCHPTLSIKPKIFVFNCCRFYTGADPREPVVDREWMDGTTRTFICYACADGTESFYTGNGYTLYGEVFSHCIAEYACDLNLTQIFNKTCDEMNRAIIQQRPELIMKNVDRELYFNPGLYKAK